MYPEEEEYMKYPGYGSTYDYAIQAALKTRKDAGYDDSRRFLTVAYHRVEYSLSGPRHLVVLK